MSATQQIVDLKIWANSIEILFLECGFNPKENPIVYFGDEDNSIKYFKEVAEKLNIKTIFCTIRKIDSEVLDYFENDIYNSGNDSRKKFHQKDMDKVTRLKDYLNEYLSFKLFMIYDGILYTCSLFTEEDMDYMDVEWQVEKHKNKALESLE